MVDTPQPERPSRSYLGLAVDRVANVNTSLTGIAW